MAFFNEREEVEEINFQRELKWVEDEFDTIFESKTKITEKDRELVKMLMNKLSETINKCKNEQLLEKLVETLRKIEKKFPEL